MRRVIRIGIFILILASWVRGYSQFTVVEWTFPNDPDDSIADGGAPGNLDKVITVHGGVAPPTYIEEGITTNCASATHWANGAYSKYWQVEFSTTGYGDLTFESWQNSFSPGEFGPKYFDIQYRIGASGTWTTFITWSIWTGNHWFQIPPAAIPSVCDNQPSLYIRWLMTSNIPTQGSGLVNDAASNRIDDIIIKCYCPYPDTAGPISGTPLVCVPETGIPYSIPAIAGATDYTWNYSGSGVTINGSSTSVTLDFSSAATSGILSVYGSNSCGNGVPATYPITVHPSPEVSASPVSQTICPGTAITPIALSSGKDTPGTTLSWVRDNTVVLTGIPSSGSSNPITGTLNSSNPQYAETTLFTITAQASGCSSTTTASVTVVDDQPPFFLAFPDSVFWCVQDIVEAWWDGMGDITPERPDYHTFYSGSTELDLNPATFSDDCAPQEDLFLHWRIELVGGTTISSSGQISSYPSDIQFPLGDNLIIYWLEDPSGNVTPEASRPVVIVRVLARPDITRNF
ncbi:MAG: hypothetical protein JXA23_05235 [Bacteroidales bacterium]|nr:hypothetical protein [Bacteroidales bacterium]